MASKHNEGSEVAEPSREHTDVKEDQLPCEKSIHHKKSGCLKPSCVSLKRDHSKHGVPDFHTDHSTTEPKNHHKKSGCHMPSCVSLKSDHSKQGLLNFHTDHSTTEPNFPTAVRPEVNSAQSTQLQQQTLDSIFECVFFPSPQHSR